MIAREQRISLMIDRKERRFATRSMPEKYDTFEFLASWLRTLSPPDLSFAIHDLCKRYSVDPVALSRSSSMDWDDLAKLAADPLATIGSATVNYFALSNLKEADAQREMTMGKAVAETALHHPVSHFAYPFGDQNSFRRSGRAGIIGARASKPYGSRLRYTPRNGADGSWRRNPDRHDRRKAKANDQEKGRPITAGRIMNDAGEPGSRRTAADQSNGDGAEYRTVMRSLEGFRHDRSHHGRQRITEKSLRKDHGIEQQVRLRILQAKQRRV